MPPWDRGRPARTTAKTVLSEGTLVLTEAGIESPAREARLLLAHALGTDQPGLLRDLDRPIDPTAYKSLLDRRAAREPLALIVGHQEFWSLRFEVSPDTLIPRADSETLIEAALTTMPPVHRILDLGTGTGCLLLAALTEYPQAWGVGVEISPAAAALARRNAQALGLADRACFLCGSWADAICSQFNLLLSNPPYLRSDELEGLMPEVRKHEPAQALVAGDDGLAAYRAIIAALPRLLAPRGMAVLELGYGQSESVTALAEQVGQVTTRSDLAGIPRALMVQT